MQLSKMCRALGIARMAHAESCSTSTVKGAKTLNSQMHQSENVEIPNCKRQFDTLTTQFSSQFHRRCKDIACGQSVLLMAGDSLLFGDCRSVTHLESGMTIWTDDNVHSLLVATKMEINDGDCGGNY